MEMRWFYRSILYCKLLLACNGFLSPSRFSLLTGIHWTDTQVVQSQNKSCFMMLTITVDLALAAGSSASVGWLFMLHCHPPEPSQQPMKPYGCSKLQLSREALRGGALHWETAGIPLSVLLSSQYNGNQTSYIPGSFPCAKELPTLLLTTALGCRNWVKQAGGSFILNVYLWANTVFADVSQDAGGWD